MLKIGYMYSDMIEAYSPVIGGIDANDAYAMPCGISMTERLVWSKTEEMVHVSWLVYCAESVVNAALPSRIETCIIVNLTSDNKARTEIARQAPNEIVRVRSAQPSVDLDARHIGPYVKRLYQIVSLQPV